MGCDMAGAEQPVSTPICTGIYSCTFPGVEGGHRPLVVARRPRGQLWGWMAPAGGQERTKLQGGMDPGAPAAGERPQARCGRSLAAGLPRSKVRGVNKQSVVTLIN